MKENEINDKRIQARGFLGLDTPRNAVTTATQVITDGPLRTVRGTHTKSDVLCKAMSAISFSLSPTFRGDIPTRWVWLQADKRLPARVEKLW